VSSKKAVGWLLHIVGIAAGVILVLVLIQRSGFEPFLQKIRLASPFGLAAALLAYSGSWIFRTWRLRILAGPQGAGVSFFEFFKIHIASFGLNVILPARLGDLALVAFLRIKGIKTAQSAAVVLQTRILDLLALLVLVIVGIVSLDKKQRIAEVLEKLKTSRPKGVFNAVLDKLKEAYANYRHMITDGPLFIRTAAASLAVWVSEAVCCYLIALALSFRIPLPSVIIALSVANIGKGIPLTPGGIGIYEGILSAVLVLFGVPYGTAVVVAVLDHNLKKAFNLLWGIPVAAGMGMSIRKLTDLAKA
jgi:uncharacterized membrane protein YbhN (UPF0104 family)